MEFAKGRAGEAVLTATKDQHGHFITGKKGLRLVVNANPTRGGGGLDVVVDRVSDADWAPTRLMADISELLEAAGKPLGIPTRFPVICMSLPLRMLIPIMVMTGTLESAISR